MNENTSKQFKATCLFPLLKNNVRIRYNEVKKASGISYILLNLIQNDLMKEDHIVDVLVTFGIPKELHYIFAEELRKLVNMEILGTSVNEAGITDMKYFRNLYLNDFRLTLKGNKMFKDGAIPTGNEKELACDLYYSPLYNQYKDTNKFKLINIDDSYLLENLFDYLNPSTGDAEDYLNTIKNKIGLKKEELIVSVKDDDNKSYYAYVNDNNMNINIENNELKFVFNDSNEQAFFNKYYDLRTINYVLKANEKLNFNLENVITKRIIDINNINEVYLPSELNKISKQPCDLFLTSSSDLFNVKEDKLIPDDVSYEILKTIDEDILFATCKGEICKCYYAYNVQFPTKVLGEEEIIGINLLIEKQLQEEDFKKVLNYVFKYYITTIFDINNCKKISYIAKSLDNPLFVKAYTIEKLRDIKSDEDKVNMILDLKLGFNNFKDYNTIFTEQANLIIDDYVKTVTIENIIEKHIVLKPLKKELNISNYDYITKLSKNIVETESKDLVFAALDSAGFKETDILPIANVVEEFMDKIINHEEIEHNFDFDNNFIMLNKKLWEICDMLGIKNENDYTLTDNYNIDNFFNCYATLKDVLSKVEPYRLYAKIQYEKIDNILNIIKPIHQFLSVERTASANPNNITEKYIEQIIARGKYSEVVSNLLVKLQYDLRKILNKDKEYNAAELISLARDNKIIDRVEEKELNMLRQCRNGFQHPERKQKEFTEDDLIKWKKIVFSIKGN